MSVHVVELSPTALRERMGEALRVYVAAMGYPEETEAQRAPMWAEHALRPGWAAVAALDTATDQLVGIGYGYRSARGQWWSEEVRAGLLANGRPASDAEHVLGSTFELTELHVHPVAQGAGLGAQLLTALLRGRPEQRVLLSTPEVGAEDNRAWRLYRRTGFGDLLRHFRFTGDPRPFAVLGRDLPMP